MIIVGMQSKNDWLTTINSTVFLSIKEPTLYTIKFLLAQKKIFKVHSKITSLIFFQSCL